MVSAASPRPEAVNHTQGNAYHVKADVAGTRSPSPGGGQSPSREDRRLGLQGLHFRPAFFKRISGVGEEEYEDRLAKYKNNEKLAANPDEQRFHIPKHCFWADIRKHITNIGVEINRAYKASEGVNWWCVERWQIIEGGNVMSDLVFQQYLNLIKTIRNLKLTCINEKENYFAVCGFPHFENVASNVLSFFLNAENGHGFGTLFFDALVKCCGIGQEFDGHAFRVSREVVTGNNKRIDIMLEDGFSCFVIENKIWAPLTNDLDDYYAYAREIFLEKNIFGVIIGIRRIESPTKNFVSITWKDLIREIRRKSGNVFGPDNLRYQQLANEFFLNISGLSNDGGMGMKKEFLDFIKNNKSDVFDFYMKVDGYYQALRGEAAKVVRAIKGQYETDHIKPWIYDGKKADGLFVAVVVDISYENDSMLAIDAVFDESGWHFDVFYRIFQKTQYPDMGKEVMALCKKAGLNCSIKDKDEQHKVRLEKHFVFNAQLVDVIEFLLDIVRRFDT